MKQQIMVNKPVGLEEKVCTLMKLLYAKQQRG